MNSTRKKRNPGYKIEMGIIFIIAGCLLFLIFFADRKLEEIIISDREALLIQHDPTDKLHEELADSIIDFRPDACKMIEVFSEDLQPIFRIQFRDDDEHTKEELEDYPELVRLLNNNEDGHTQVTIGDEEEDVYFRWTETVSGDKRLVIIYMSRPIVHNMWVFHLVCYTILILVFILFILLQLKGHRDKVEQYKTISLDVQSTLIH